MTIKLTENVKRLIRHEQEMLATLKGKSWAQRMLTVVDITNGTVGHISHLETGGNLENWILGQHSLKERIDLLQTTHESPEGNDANGHCPF